MQVIWNKNTEAPLNLALEEWLLTTAAQDCFMLWRNSPAIIVGRNQNTLEEINAAFVAERQISVVRRLSGGGAVYHDLGNVNFTFICHDTAHAYNFARFSQPVLDVLHKLGVPAEFAGRNDLVIEGRKFSGNAQYVQGSKVLHHGTLLYDSDLSVLSGALNAKPEKFESKGIKSISSRTTNIKPYLAQPLAVEDFAAMLLQHIKDAYPDAEFAGIGPEGYAAARELAAKRYGNKDWNYGKSSPYNFRNQLRYPGGIVECRLFVDQGIIRSAKIYGDFFGNKAVEELEALLVGTRHTYDDIRSRLEKVEVGGYFAGLDQDGFLKVLL